MAMETELPDLTAQPRLMELHGKNAEKAPEYNDPITSFFRDYAYPRFHAFMFGPKPVPVPEGAAEAKPLVDPEHPLSKTYGLFQIDQDYRRYQELQDGYGKTAEGRQKAMQDPELLSLAQRIAWTPPLMLDVPSAEQAYNSKNNPHYVGDDIQESPEGNFVHALNETMNRRPKVMEQQEGGAEAAEPPAAETSGGGGEEEPVSMTGWADRYIALRAKYPATLEGGQAAIRDPEVMKALINSRGYLIELLTNWKGTWKTVRDVADSTRPFRRVARTAHQINVGGRRAEVAPPSFDHVTDRGPPNEQLPEVPKPGGFTYDDNPSSNGMRLLRAQDKAMGGAGEVTAIRNTSTGDVHAWPSSMGDHGDLTQAVTGTTIEPGLVTPERLPGEMATPTQELQQDLPEPDIIGGAGAAENHGNAGTDRLTDAPLHEQRVSAYHAKLMGKPAASPDVQAETFRQKMAADAAGVSPQGAAAIAIQHPDDADATYAELQRQRSKEEPFSFTGAEEKAGRPPSIFGAAMDVLTSMAQTPLALLGAAASAPKAVYDSYKWLHDNPMAAWGEDPAQRSTAYQHALNVAGALNVSEALGVTQAEGSMTLGAGAVRGGVKTFHGSPYKWDTIDPSKAGSGEGTAMAGWGFYSAEEPKVAKSYKSLIPGAGNLYEVQINRRPEEYLDLDKPLTEQSPAVQQALSGFGYKAGERAPDAAIETQQYKIDKLTRQLRERSVGSGYPIWKQIQSEQRKLKMMQGGAELTGDDIYKQMVADNDNNMKDVSAKLEAAGIPGARFLDQYSRDAASVAKGMRKVGVPGAGLLEGNPTHNFVSFNPTKDVTVLSRNGQPLAAGEVPDLQMQEIGIGPQAARMAATAAATDPSGSRAIGAVDLRSMSYPAALEIARTQRHVIPGQDGQFVGAPRGMASRQKLTSMRRKYDAAVDAGVDGSRWYSAARGAIQDVAGMDPARQSLLARQWALFSPQATVDQNLGFQLLAHNAWLAGHPLDIAHTGTQARTFNKAMDAGTEIPLAQKTGVFGQTLDPTKPLPSTGTNDIWQGRAMGYGDGPSMESGFSPQEHAFMDAETVLAADRANQRKTGGRSDWNPSEVQAAAWVTTKGTSDGLKFYDSGVNIDPKTGKKAFTKEEAIAKGIKDAARSFPDFIPKYTAFMTEEDAPYVNSDHMKGLSSAPDDVKKAYTDAANWRDIQGRDRLAADMGMFVRSSGDATGIYHPPGGGVTEFNPMAVARPLVGFSGPDRNRTVDPNTAALLDSIGAIKGYMGVQGAVPWHLARANQSMKNSAGYRVPMGRVVSHDELEQLDNLMGPKGLMPVPTGDGITVIPREWGDPAPITQALKGGLDAQIRQILPDAGKGAFRAGISGGYPSFEDELAAERAGQGKATEKLFQILDANPEIFRRADAAPSIRAMAIAQFNRDADIWTWENGASGKARADVQAARKIMGGSDRPLTALRAALKSGEIALPAVLLYSVLSGIPSGGDGS